jgi:hypothetical protein
MLPAAGPQLAQKIVVMVVWRCGRRTGPQTARRRAASRYVPHARVGWAGGSVDAMLGPVRGVLPLGVHLARDCAPVLELVLQLCSSVGSCGVTRHPQRFRTLRLALSVPG